MLEESGSLSFCFPTLKEDVEVSQPLFTTGGRLITSQQKIVGAICVSYPESTQKDISSSCFVGEGQKHNCGLITCSLLFVSASRKRCQWCLSFICRKGFRSVAGTAAVGSIPCDVANWSASILHSMPMWPVTQKILTCLLDIYTVHSTEDSSLGTEFLCLRSDIIAFTTLRESVIVIVFSSLEPFAAAKGMHSFFFQTAQVFAHYCGPQEVRKTGL